MLRNPLTPDASHERRRWEIERFVLQDPTLDLAAFEARMLDDPQLAEEVAVCVSRLQQMAAACRLATPPAIATVSASASCGPSSTPPRWTAVRGKLLAAASLAATVAVVWAAWPSESPRPTKATALRQPLDELPVGSQPRLAEIAQQWMVLESAADEPPPVELDPQAPSFVSDDSDWMLQVPAEFFEESDG